LHSTARTVTIDIFNDGKLLPEYAVAKAFERYFSLSHQSQPSFQIMNQATDQTTNQTGVNDLNTESADPTTEPRQTDYSSNTLKKGTGLGLTLVKQVIEHHGGQVVINNVHANDNKATDNTDTGKNQRSGVMVSITLPLA